MFSRLFPQVHSKQTSGSYTYNSSSAAGERLCPNQPYLTCFIPLNLAKKYGNYLLKNTIVESSQALEKLHLTTTTYYTTQHI